jgi:ribosome modulation factor
MYRISVDIGELLGKLFGSGHAKHEDVQPELQPALALAGAGASVSLSEPILASTAAAAVPASSGDGRTEWHVGLDEAYELGYKAALEGQPRQAAFELEVLAASWEAGWDDGAEEARRS